MAGTWSELICLIAAFTTHKHYDFIKSKHFLRYWPFIKGIQWSPMDSPKKKASDAELWCFLWYVPEQTVVQRIETPLIWDTITLIMTSLQYYDVSRLEKKLNERRDWA